MVLRFLVVLVCVVTAVGCAARRPVIYPDERATRAGDATADREVERCEALAKSRGSSRSAELARDGALASGSGAAIGAASGAIWGAAARGAAAGAAGGAVAGLLHGIVASSEPSPTYQSWVATCLGDRGYRVVGWE